MPMTDAATPPPAAARRTPWVELRSARFHIFLYQKMIKGASADAAPGDCVAVYDRQGALFGYGLYNPRSRIVVRMLSFGDTPVDDSFWRTALERAVTLRTNLLRLDEQTTACRLVHAEGDELSGLVVDRYADVLSIEVFSAGIWHRLDALLPVLHEVADTRHHGVQMDDDVQRLERCQAQPLYSPDMPRSVDIVENGVRFRVRFDAGHKTGFFCDQRDNRRRLAGFAGDAEVLDLCCYSGGFGLYARVLGGAREVTCVDLDEQAVEMARRNANLNQVRVNTVHADAFAYMRQMRANGRTYGVVVLDPPRLIFGRNDADDGRTRYFDLNRLAAGLVRPGGLLLTCSCSGALPRDRFVDLVIGAARQAGRQARILDLTGAAPDHPVSPRCPESAYLKAAWLRLH